jgi:hypothetical protein
MMTPTFSFKPYSPPQNKPEFGTTDFYPTSITKPKEPEEVGLGSWRLQNQARKTALQQQQHMMSVKAPAFVPGASPEQKESPSP